MAWSNSVRLRDYYSAPDARGVYEIGFLRDGIFNPLYVGKADSSVYDRLKRHYEGRGNQHVMSYLVTRERDNLWCHWMGVQDPGYTEANLMNNFGIGDDGVYKFNCRLETKKPRA